MLICIGMHRLIRSKLKIIPLTRRLNKELKN
jgi:hypothetical protein